MRGEPLMHRRVIMSAVIVADQMQLPLRVAAGQGIEEFDKFLVAMAPDNNGHGTLPLRTSHARRTD